MAVVQELLKSDISEEQKHTTLLDFDRVLGLDLDRVDKKEILPQEVQNLIDARKTARKAKEWATSDRLREEILALGYLVQDTKDGMKVIKK